LGQRKSGLLRQVTVPLKRGSIHIKFSMTGQEKDDCLIEVTTWAGLTVYLYTFCNCHCICMSSLYHCNYMA